MTERTVAKRLLTAALLLLTLCLTTGCMSTVLTRLSATETPRQRFWGSYTAEKTWSFDRRYYALQTVERAEGGSRGSSGMIVVTVYNAETNAPAAEFRPARSMDFWGICWERDSYNIWAQSGDIGDYCWEYRDGTWERNVSLSRPDYIISRYDGRYRDHPELWDEIYMSPTD